MAGIKTRKAARALTGGLAALILAGAGAALAGPMMMGGFGAGAVPTFAELDSNQDGMIDSDEVRAHMLARIMVHDTDGDGQISRDEFIAMAEARQEMMSEHITERMSERMAARMAARGGMSGPGMMAERAAAMFDRLDENGDGLLDPARLGPMNLDRMIARIDSDADGLVSQAEWDAMVEKMGQRHGRGHGHGHGHRHANDG